MLMTSILMSIMLMVSILMIGCASQPPPIPTPVPTPTLMVMPTITPVPTLMPLPPRSAVIDSLIQFNDINNNFIRFLSVNGDIYQLEGESTYHVAYVASKQIMLALKVYADAINNWTIPDTEYHDRLMEIKTAELYRIKHFSELTELMLITLPTENDETIQAVREQFLEWRDDARNMKPMNLQNDILKELNIDTEDVNFLYVVPDEPIPATPLPSLPAPFNKGDNRSQWMN